MSSEHTQARMRGFLILCVFLQLASALPQQKLSAQSTAQTTAKRPVLLPQTEKLAASAIQLPLFFEANRGQTDPNVRYVARGNGYTMFLTPSETVLVQEKTKKGSNDKFSPGSGLLRTNAKTSADVLRMQLIGANPAPEFSGLEEIPGKVNYLIGKNPAQWHTGVPLYSQVRVSTVYPGVDLLFHGDQQQLEYDFIVSPGADPSKVAFRFSGAKEIEIDSDGDLILHAGDSDFRMRRPMIYQTDGSSRRLIDGSFVLSAKNEVSFKLGPYDHGQELVIDPAINYATFLGGAGTDLAEALQVDTSTPGAPKVYVAGETSDITTFPEGGTSIGNPKGTVNVFIAKVDPTKTGSASLVYLSFIGGSTPFPNSGGTKCESAGAWLALDTSQGASSVEPVIGGVTSCADYPGSLLNPVTATSDASATVVTRVASNGGSVDQSILLGGNGQMSVGYVFVDSSGNVLLTGPTQSTNLPTIAGAYATAFNNGGSGAASGTYDCFTAKLQRSNLAPTYFSYLNVGAGSSSNSESGCGAVIDSVNENILYVGGNTESSVAFSGAGTGVFGFQPTFQGTQDSFLMKLDTSLSGTAELKFATYFGGGGTTGVKTGAADLGTGIVANSSGVIALAGHTTSNSTSNAPDIPILNPFPGQGTNAAADSENQETGFFTIMDTTKTGAASLLCGSYFGGSSGSDLIRSLAFDPLIPFGYYVIVGGLTQSTDFPTVNAFQGTLVTQAGAQDGFVAGLMVNPGGNPSSQISFSSYIGAGASEEIDGVGLDTNHTIYATGITVSGNYYGNTTPTTTVNGFQPTCTSCSTPGAQLPDAVIFALTSAPTASLNAINVFPSSATLPVSGTQQFLAIGTFSDGTFQDLTNSVTWNSSNTTTAMINSSGLATAGTTAGMTTITAATGEVTSPGAPLTVGAASSVTLSVDLINNGSSGVGTVTDSTGQINCTNTGGELQSGTCSASYAVGTNVTFTETPGVGSVFTGWQDDCSGTTTTCMITVSASTGPSVLANFGNGTGTFTLNITPGSGETGGGQVSSQIGAAGTISCTLNGSSATKTCSATVKSGSVFVLIEAANATSNFAGWSGACSGTGGCVVTMSQNQTVSPTFTTQQNPFAVTITGNGAVTSISNPTVATEINCANPLPPSVCSTNFASGTQVTLTATPATGYSFSSWTAGPCNGSPTNTCAFTVSSSTSSTATAAFTVNTYLLTVVRAGTAGGTITSNVVNSEGGGISCGPAAGIAGCSVIATYNAPVVLTETPPTGSSFSGWSGTPTSCVVVGATCTFNMPAASETVTGTFSTGTGSNPVLGITKTHTGNFTQGQSGATYTVTVSNAAGVGPTNGTVTVTDTIPTGLTLVSMAGTGWTCATSSCTRTDVLAAGASYPAITVTVNVASNAPASVVNAASVSGGGSATANATDTTTITTASGSTFTLAVTPASGATGNGVVTDSSGAMNCTFNGTAVPTGTCSAGFPSGTVVTLSAVAADDGSIFTGWSGPCSGSATCAVTLTQSEVVTARFTIPATQLIVADFNPDDEGDNDKQRIDGKSPPLQILLTNTSATQSVAFTGAPVASSGYTATTDCTTLGPNQSCHVFVSFTATSVCQNVLGTVTLNDNDPGGSFVINVNGYGSDTGIQVNDLTDSTLSAQALAQSLVGPGVQISNVTYTGALRAAGNFTSSSNILGFTSGIVLSTGSVRDVVGPNCSADISVDNGEPGDADLNTIVGEGNDTNDAAVLEFDFVPTSSVISFQYVFASDEYNEFVFDFNDVFGFFLTDKSTGTKTNIALIPGTDLPVSINNVNDGNPLGTNPVNPQFYINNDFQFPTAAPVDTEMNGLTVVFTAQAQVTPNNAYHIKLAIADANDFALDSNVFVQAGSLTSSTLTLTPGTLAFGNQQVGTTSTSQPITVTNVGSQTVTIGNIVAGTNFTEANNCPATLSAVGSDGSSCTVNVSFAPGTSGSLTSSLTVTYTTPSSDTPQTQTATLTGTGTGTATNETLTVMFAGTGTGTVTSAPAGISCPTTCSANFASATQVTLTASASANSTFAGWSGGGCTGAGTCVVTVTAATAVTATFNSASPVTIGIGQGSSSTVTTTPGSSAVFGLVLTALPGTTGTVQLTCSSPVASITCNIVPSSITLTGKAINVAIVVETFCKGWVPKFVPMPGAMGNGLGLLLATLCLCGMAWRYKKQPRWAVSFGLLIIFAVGMTACSNVAKSPSGSATPPGNYPLTVTATAPNGATSSVNLTLVVK
jgi:hypothetical protein